MRAYTTISRTTKTIVITCFVFFRDELVIGVGVVEVILVDARDLGENVEEGSRDEEGEVFLGPVALHIKLVDEFADDRVEGDEQDADPEGFLREAHCLERIRFPEHASNRACERGAFKEGGDLTSGETRDSVLGRRMIHVERQSLNASRKRDARNRSAQIGRAHV